MTREEEMKELIEQEDIFIQILKLTNQLKDATLLQIVSDFALGTILALEKSLESEEEHD